MARAYQDAHALDNVLTDVKALKATVLDLQKTRGIHEEKITNLTKQNTDLAKKNAELETRVKAKYVLFLPSSSPFSLSLPSFVLAPSKTYMCPLST